MDDKTKYFVVTCHGWSGSHWLATVLNLHPELLCCHSALNIPADVETWANQKLQNTIASRQVARAQRGLVSTDELFEKSEALGEAKVYGNVHTLRIRDLPEINSRFKAVRPYFIMNMVRHPVSLVASGTGQLVDMMDWDIYAKIEIGDAVREEIDLAWDISSKYGINLCENRNGAFITACHHMKHLARDRLIAPDAPTIVMEKVIADRDYFSQVFEQLTSGALKVSDDYLEKVFAIGKLNRHRAGPTKTPQQEFSEWSDWKREMFARIFNKYRLGELYGRFGYDFDFINQSQKS